MERRHSQRCVTNVNVLARIPATPIALTIVDLSLTGCRVKVRDIALNYGNTVLLEIAGIKLAGEVAWVVEDTCGIRFNNPIPAEHLPRMIDNSASGRTITAYSKPAFGRRVAGRTDLLMDRLP